MVRPASKRAPITSDIKTLQRSTEKFPGHSMTQNEVPKKEGGNFTCGGSRKCYSLSVQCQAVDGDNDPAVSICGARDRPVDVNNDKVVLHMVRAAYDRFRAAVEINGAGDKCRNERIGERDRT